MKRLIFLIIVVAVLIVPGVLLGSACGNEQPASAGAIEDDRGRVVELDRYPERIVSLAPSCTEMLFALGLADEIVGVTTYCNYPAAALDKEKAGGFSPDEWNEEKILELEPDLVIVSGGIQTESIDAIEKRGLTVFVVDPQSIDGVIDSLKTLGELTGHEEEAEALAGDMQERIDAVTTSTESMTQDQKRETLFVVWHDPLYTVAGNTLETELIDKAGGINIADATGQEGFGVIDLEIVLDEKPEVIIAYTGHGSSKDDPLNWVKEESRLAGTPARENNRIYQMDTDIIGRAGPRIVDALEQVAQCIHPELFGD